MELLGLSDAELNAVLLKIVESVHRIEEGVHSE